MPAITLLFFALFLAASVPAYAGEAAAPVGLRSLELTGPADSSHAQLSGLAWRGDDLLLLPQYPDFSPRRDQNATAEKPSPRLFALNRAIIVDALRSRRRTPLTPREIPIVGPDFRAAIPGFEGFEAIAADGDHAYLVIESKPERGNPAMRGFLVRGVFQGDSLVLDEELIPLAPPAALANMCFESIFVWNDAVWVFYEANGANVNPAPRALRFTLDGEPLEPAVFPHVEYRITDVTAVDDAGEFWCVNFYWPGERKLLKPAADPIAARWGSRGDAHGVDEVERLLRCTVNENGVALKDAPPVDLDLSFLPSNWEGAASLTYKDGDRTVSGVLLVTDTYPVTRFAFAPVEHAAAPRRD